MILYFPARNRNKFFVREAQLHHADVDSLQGTESAHLLLFDPSSGAVPSRGGQLELFEGCISPQTEFFPHLVVGYWNFFRVSQSAVRLSCVSAVLQFL